MPVIVRLFHGEFRVRFRFIGHFIWTRWNVSYSLILWHLARFPLLPNNKIHLHVGWMLLNDATLQRWIDWLTPEETKKCQYPIDRIYLCRKLWMIIECLWGFTQFAIDHRQVKFPTKLKNKSNAARKKHRRLKICQLICQLSRYCFIHSFL